MKGMDLTISTIILIVLGVIVLLSFIVLLGGSKNQVDIVIVREALRNCCADRSIYNCQYPAGMTATCRVPWQDDTLTIEELRVQANVPSGSLNDFCYCS
ncbi:MAG: hypothetical protein V1678_03070 [Candidatus Aenigmatarchaeota archaeon]